MSLDEAETLNEGVPLVEDDAQSAPSRIYAIRDGMARATMATALIGSVSGLSFDIAWDTEEPSGTAAEVTRGQLSASIGGSQVWAAQGRGFSWTWIELLAYLSENWRWIEWEEMDPLGLGSQPERLRSDAEQRWDDVPSSRRDDEEEVLWSFEQRHNLAAGIQGAWLRDLWILRCGNEFRISGANQEVWQSSRELLATLVELGDRIASRLATCEDDRAREALLAWRARRELSAEQFVSTVTSLRSMDVDAITRGREPEAFWELGDRREPNEILAVARMAAPLLRPEDMRAILERVRRLKAKLVSRLDGVVEAMPPLAPGKPFDQGYALAVWLRGELGNVSERIEPEELLRAWRVEIKDIELETSAVDAICCWGPRHGPVIFVNGRGRHASHEAGRRSTLAHEICHLIVDRKRALPLAEVLGGRVPKSVEARARAFAAEFLLPRELAMSTLRSSQNAAAAVRKLTSRFGVSREIVAWQVRNSDEAIPSEHAVYLRGLVSEPERF